MAKSFHLRPPPRKCIVVAYDSDDQKHYWTGHCWSYFKAEATRLSPHNAHQLVCRTNAANRNLDPADRMRANSEETR